MQVKGQLLTLSNVCDAVSHVAMTVTAYEYIPDTTFADNAVLTGTSHTTSPTNYQAVIPTADI